MDRLQERNILKATYDGKNKGVLPELRSWRSKLKYVSKRHEEEKARNENLYEKERDIEVRERVVKKTENDFIQKHRDEGINLQNPATMAKREENKKLTNLYSSVSKKIEVVSLAKKTEMTKHK